MKDKEIETPQDVAKRIVEAGFPPKEDKELGDPVNNPDHYATGEIECIDAIQTSLTEEEFRGYCKGNIMKYIWRERKKGGVESCKKAQWYLNRMIESTEIEPGIKTEKKEKRFPFDGKHSVDGTKCVCGGELEHDYSDNKYTVRCFKCGADGVATYRIPAEFAQRENAEKLLESKIQLKDNQE